MSKAGVSKRSSNGEAVEAIVEVKQRRKRIELTKLVTYRIANRQPEEVDAKLCSKCGTVRCLSSYKINKKCLGGVNSYCRSCDTYLSHIYYLTKKPSVKRRVRWNLRSYCKAAETLGYQVLGEEFVNVISAIPHRHLVCGHEWSVAPYAILSGGTYCPKCTSMWVRTEATYREEIEELYRGEYRLLGAYVDAKTPVIHLHTKCGYAWPVSPSKIRSRRPCPKCKESKGEKEISKLLDLLEVPYKIQHRIEECRNIRPLPFDFAVFSNDTLKLLIEFDGEQHSQPIECFGGRDALARTRIKDRIKTEYCRANDIPLIRIDYTQFDEIETILTEELTKLGVISAREEASAC